jgi:16S rRNA (guanine966-N2)-methyltransferase
MRIVAGKLKGSLLFLPKNKNTRPLKDITRESIFNLLKHSNKIFFKFEKSTILDLYSGTGSFGLECLSRESELVYFVEKDKEAIKILEKNIQKLNQKQNAEIVASDSLNFIKDNVLDIKFDLIFCDPPFKDDNINKLIELILRKKLLKKDGLVILHRNKKIEEKLPNFLKIIDERIYGLSKIIFGKISF